MERIYKDIDVVHSDDLSRLLEKVGLIDRFNAGELKCKFCGDIVTRDNIYSVIKDSGQYKVVCEKAGCINQLLQFLATRKKKVL